MPRHRLLIAYDGTDFHGWQRQIRPDRSELRTVQWAIEQAVYRVTHERVPVVGASRTDAGVHAIGQVAAFDSEKDIPIDRIAMALTSRLPEDVQVRSADIVPDSFDPIAHATRKCYRYDYAWGRPPECWPPLFERRTTFHTPHRLDADRMRDAASRLVGTHDVAGLAQKHHGREDTKRTIFQCRITEPDAHRVRMEIEGNGFLYNMVRIIAGTLLDVGRGHVDPDRIDRILDTGDRRLAGQTLPPEGLCLRWIDYGTSTSSDASDDARSEGDRP